MTDPSLRRPADHLHLPAHRQLRRRAPRRWSPTRVWARAAIMRAAVNREDAPTAERGWLDWLTDCGIPAITGVDTRALVRHIREAGAMRGGVFAGVDARVRGARADRGRAVDGRPGPRPRRHAGARDRPRQRHGPRIAAIDTGIKGSIVRNLVAARRAGHAAPCTRDAPTSCSPPTPTRFFLANGPGDPAALGYVVADGARARRPPPGVGHLPRPPAALPGGRPGDVQAAVRPPRRQPPGQGPADRQHRDHLAEPRLRGAPRPTARGTIDADEAVRWETDFGAAELTHVNLYDRTVEGLSCSTCRRDRPVPPGGRPRPARQPLPLRPLPRCGGARCRDATTSTRS